KREWVIPVPSAPPLVGEAKATLVPVCLPLTTEHSTPESLPAVPENGQRSSFWMITPLSFGSIMQPAAPEVQGSEVPAQFTWYWMSTCVGSLHPPAPVPVPSVKTLTPWLMLVSFCLIFHSAVKLSVGDPPSP